MSEKDFLKDFGRNLEESCEKSFVDLAHWLSSELVDWSKIDIELGEEEFSQDCRRFSRSGPIQLEYFLAPSSVQ